MVNLTQVINGHGHLMINYIKDYTKIQEGPQCPLLGPLGIIEDYINRRFADFKGWLFPSFVGANFFVPWCPVLFHFLWPHAASEPKSTLLGRKFGVRGLRFGYQIEAAR